MAIFPIFTGQLSDDHVRNRLKQLLKICRKMQLFYVIRWDSTLKCGSWPCEVTNPSELLQLFRVEVSSVAATRETCTANSILNSEYSSLLNRESKNIFFHDVDCKWCYEGGLIHLPGFVSSSSYFRLYKYMCVWEIFGPVGYSLCLIK